MIIRNKTAKRDYELLDKTEAGIVLSGAEAKAVKTQGAKLDGAYVKIVDGNALLINAHIPRYSHSSDADYDASRTRRLLLHKKEIVQIKSKMAQNRNLTLVPVSMYTARGLVKIEIALARGRKLWQKKSVEKRKTEKRAVEREIRARGRS